MSKIFYRMSDNRELSLLCPNNASRNIKNFGQEFRDLHTAS